MQTDEVEAVISSLDNILEEYEPKGITNFEFERYLLFPNGFLQNRYFWRVYRSYAA